MYTAGEKYISSLSAMETSLHIFNGTQQMPIFFFCYLVRGDNKSKRTLPGKKSMDSPVFIPKLFPPSARFTRTTLKKYKAESNLRCVL